MRTFGAVIVAGGMGLALSGCGSLHSDLASYLIDTTPPGAACAMMRGDQPIGAVDSTPGIVNLDPAATTGLNVVCRRPGYAEAVVPVPPSVTAGSWGVSYPEPQQVHIALAPGGRAATTR